MIAFKKHYKQDETPAQKQCTAELSASYKCKHSEHTLRSDSGKQ